MDNMLDDDKKLLTPYAEIFADLLKNIEELDGDELAALTKACDAPTATNCWWAIKRAADFLKPEIAREYGRRTMLEMKRVDDGIRAAASTPIAQERGEGE